MDEFIKSYFDFTHYPRNLVHHNTYIHNLEAYSNRLRGRKDRLCCTEAKAKLVFLELQDEKSVFHEHEVKTDLELIDQLRAKDLPKVKEADPQCRFVFIHAGHELDTLDITYNMLLRLFTYHQVLPSFTDFLLTFGAQNRKQDIHFGVFRGENWLRTVDRGLKIPELGRSGKQIRMCYYLKSVEPSKSEPNSDWSIRQAAVYHGFDVETGQATWIIVKANREISKRIATAATTNDDGYSRFTQCHATHELFRTTLAVHHIICSWSGENWTQYISDLGDEVQNQSRRLVTEKVETPTTNPILLFSPLPPTIQSRQTMPILSGEPDTPFANTRRTRTPTAPPSMDLGLAPPIPTSRPRSNMPRLPPIPPPHLPPSLITGRSFVGDARDKQAFSFENILVMQNLEERANGARHVLNTNLNVLTMLKQYYLDLRKNDDLNIIFKENCMDDIWRFEQRICNIISDLKMQVSRLDALLKILGDRKELLYARLEYQNMEASKAVSERTQASTEHMENMTQKMSLIAEKTQQETVSMRVITLITLFFLPGTFISTIMSTDIVKWKPNSDGIDVKTVQPDAIWLYFIITLPFMFASFVAWYAIYWWESDGKQKFKHYITVIRLGKCL